MNFSLTPTPATLSAGMNIWSLAKDVYLKHLLLELAERFGIDSFVPSERWREDFQAVGIDTPNEPGLSAYVFTYGQEPGKYGLHLEYPRHPDSAPENVANQKEGISLNDLVDILRQHLELEP